ncbi:hypothetical protein [Azospirillum picis]|uniref:Uncharacterized protein n=1 Tax=Azospirillum picis TaxID=488438 RepID=A0ABU0MDP6_9PROT|nr:hypothetical protein [Azospirillum picis]MBP2297426.1 hypothetical protein [Azospirillum picis]MDQ0531551.1 hypothetical protein [Azospirillum picis]
MIGLESILVGFIVAAAFLWVAWSILLPASVRVRLRRLAGHPPEAQSRASSGCAGGCCGCDAAGRRPLRSHVTPEGGSDGRCAG